MGGSWHRLAKAGRPDFWIDGQVDEWICGPAPKCSMRGRIEPHSWAGALPKRYVKIHTEHGEDDSIGAKIILFKNDFEFFVKCT